MSTNGKTRFFYNASFSTQPQLQMLLKCYLVHISIILMRHFLYLLTIFVSMSWSRSTYVVSIEFIFDFQLDFHYD